MWPSGDKTEKVGRHVQIKFKPDNWEISLADLEKGI